MSARTTKRLRFETLEDRLTPSLTPVAGEFRVNQLPDEWQRWSSITSTPSGDFLVAYQGYEENLFPLTGNGIVVQRYHANGQLVVSPIAVEETGDIIGGPTSIATDSAGKFTVVWTKWPGLMVGPLPANAWTILGRQFDANGQPLGSTFNVNPVNGSVEVPNIAYAPNGDFVVTWKQSFATNGSILARRFANNGTPITGAMIIAEISGNETGVSRVSFSADGSYTVGWQASNAVWFTRFNSANQAITGSINVGATGFLFFDLLTDGNGNIVVAYVDRITTPSPIQLGNYIISDRVGIRRYDPTGVSIGSHFTSEGRAPSLARISNSELVMTWEVSAGNIDRALAMTFDLSNNPTSSQISINVAADCDRPRVASNHYGDVMFAWDSLQPNYDPSVGGNPLDIYARNYAGNAAAPAAPPTINGGTASRSSVKDVNLDFTRPVVLPANPAMAFQLTSASGAAIPVAVTMPAGASSASDFKVTFPTYPAGLPDGRYTLKMLAAQVHDAAGQPLDGNGDGTPGDDLVVQFHKLTGDFDGDGVVRQSDCMAFVGAMGGTNLTFDLDADGVVDSKDFNRFRLAFMNSLP